MLNGTQWFVYHGAVGFLGDVLVFVSTAVQVNGVTSMTIDRLITIQLEAVDDVPSVIVAEDYELEVDEDGSAFLDSSAIAIDDVDSASVTLVVSSISGTVNCTGRAWFLSVIWRGDVVRVGTGGPSTPVTGRF